MQGRLIRLLQRRSLQKSSDLSSRAKEVGILVDQMLDSFLQTTNAYHLPSFSLEVVLSIGRSLLDQIFFVVSPMILTNSHQFLFRTECYTFLASDCDVYLPPYGKCLVLSSLDYSFI